jgi:hypothetical protein
MIHDVLKKQKPARVKLLDDGARTSGRRTFLQAMAAKGVLIPAAYVMWRAATDPDALAGEVHAAARLGATPQERAGRRPPKPPLAGSCAISPTRIWS